MRSPNHAIAERYNETRNAAGAEMSRRNESCSRASTMYYEKVSDESARKGGCADEAGIVPEARRHHGWYFAPMVSDHALGHRDTGGREQQIAGPSRGAPTDDDDVGIEEVHERRQPDAEPLPCVREDRQRE